MASRSESSTFATSEIRRALQRSQRDVHQNRPVAHNQRPSPDGTSSPENQGDVFSGALAGMKRQEAREAMESQMARNWSPGDVYSLHDLGPREGRKWTEMKRRPQRDIFEMIGQNPVKHYKVRHYFLLFFPSQLHMQLLRRDLARPIVG
jgi:hypothetical protein